MNFIMKHGILWLVLSPMKPQRLKLAHNLLVSYGVYRKLEVYVSPAPALIEFNVFALILW
jgi:hypothetical protein